MFISSRGDEAREGDKKIQRGRGVQKIIIPFPKQRMKISELAEVPPLAG
jgi:hypothetical protein